MVLILIYTIEIEQIELWASECSSASIQLIRSGLFPCSPVFPSLAVDIRVLDFVRRLFLRIAPNYTAWCNAATDFLASQGYHLPGDDPLRRRFANALQWYMCLNDMATASIDRALQRVRTENILEAYNPPSPLSPKVHCQDDRDPQKAEDGSNEQLGAATRGVTVGDSVDEDDEEYETRKRSRMDSDSDSGDEWDPSEHTPLTRPSEYLRSRCPLCFGGKEW